MIPFAVQWGYFSIFILEYLACSNFGFRMFFKSFQQFFVKVWGYVIVAIDETDVFSRSHVHSGIAGGTQPLIGLMNDLYAGVLTSISVAYLATTVGRAIVYQDDFQLAIGLV